MPSSRAVKKFLFVSLLSGGLLFPTRLFSASDVRINEAGANRSTAQGGDWIELFIATSADLSGWRLQFTAGSSEFSYTLPSITSSSFAGAQFAVVHLATYSAVPADETTATGDTSGNGYWDLWISSTALGTTGGMVGTDNVVLLVDASSNPVDALVFMDASGSFTTTGGRGTRYELAVASGQWTGPASSASPAAKLQNAAVNLNSTGSTIFMARDGASGDSDAAGFAKNDWGLTASPTQGTANGALGDASPPAAITDLAAASATESSVTLQWTAVGDDGSSGAASSYVVRYATRTLSTVADYFESTDLANTVGAPAAGTLTGLTVGGLSPATTYWFLVVGQDDGDTANGNFKLGGLPSNAPVSGLTASDTQAPNAVTDLSAALTNSAAGSVSLSWTAPSDPPSGGAASSYQLRFATFSAASVGGDAAWWALGTDVPSEPAPAGPGAAQAMTVSGLPSASTVYFRLRSRDAVNQSASDSGTQQAVFVPAHLLISQAKAASSGTSRFVELYNPSSSAIDLTAPQVYLHRRTATGGTDSSQALSGSVPANGFYLIARSTDATGGLALDAAWTADTTLLSADNSLYLSLSATGLADVVDAAAFGSGTDASFVDFGDANAPVRLANPSNNTAALRLPAGGAGHATDSNKWQADFLNDQAPSPRNSQSGAEPDQAAPAAISNLTAAAGAQDGTVDLSWTAPGDDGASGNLSGGQFVVKFSSAQIIRTADFDAPAFSVSTVTVSTSAAAGSAQTLTLSGLTPGTSYWFAIKTRDEASNFSTWASSADVPSVNTLAYAPAAVGPPAAPASFSGTAQSTGSILWAWSLVSGATNYQLQTSTGGLSAALADPTASYLETGLPPDTSSQIDRVQAFNSAGAGGTRVEASAPVYSFAAAPASLSVTAVTTTTVQLDWNEAGNPAWTVYEVSQSNDGFAANFSTPVAFSSGVVSPPVTVANLSPAASYSFRVRARNQDLIVTSFSNTASTATATPPLSGVVINEVMYRPNTGGEEWVEIYNNSGQAQNLTGWRLFEGGTNHTLSFVQGGSTLAAGGYAVIADSAAAFLTQHSTYPGVGSLMVIDSAFSLSNSGETLALKDSLLVTQSSLTYSSTSPWPAAAAGQSIERIDPNGPDNAGSNWAAAASPGTPGAANGATPDTTAPAAVSDLAASAGANEGEILLSWTAPGDDGSAGAVTGGQFVVKYATTGIISDFDNPPAGSATVTVSTSFAAGAAQNRTIAGLTPGASYWFAIKTRDEASNFSSWTSSAANPSVNTQAFAAAQDLAPGTPSLGGVTSFNRALSVPFSAPSPDPGDIVSYFVYRASYAFTSASDPGVTTTTYANASAAHTATSLTNGVTYYFRVQAQDAGPNFLTSALSAAAGGIPRIRAPATLSATHGGSSVSLSWSASGDAGDGNFGGYNVYRGTSSGVYAQIAAAVSGTSYADSSGISSSVNYFYVVRSSDNAAAGAFGESADSPEAVAAADSSAPVLTHVPVGFVVFKGAPLSLSASAVDTRDGTLDGAVQSMTLSVRLLGDAGAFTTIAFSGSGFGGKTAQGAAAVPASFLQSAAAAGGFTYFVTATDGANTGRSPASGAHTVAVEAPVTVTLGADGGTLSSAGGFAEVDVFPNSLPGSTTLTATPLEADETPFGTALDGIPAAEGYDGRAVSAAEFGPDGIRFRVPVRVRLRFLDTDNDGYAEAPPGGDAFELPNEPGFHADRLKVYLLSGGRWVLLGGRREGDRVSVLAKHFSTYALFPASAAPGARPGERFVTPNGDGVNDAATFGPEATRVTVYDMTGLEVWSGTGDGVTSVQWPGTDAQGRTLESGAYLYRAEGGGDEHGVVVVVR
jgi:hypothetical protein